VDTAVFVTVGTGLRLVLASEAETGGAPRGATVGPEPKQSVCRLTVVDCKALELLYKSCGFPDMPYSYDTLGKGGG
jgi:hypothetical protein